jgi:hypothetical protein
MRERRKRGESRRGRRRRERREEREEERRGEEEILERYHCETVSVKNIITHVQLYSLIVFFLVFRCFVCIPFIDN